MKLAAAALLVLALATGLVPFFANCHYEGHDLRLADGGLVPMRCYWTARAAVVPSVLTMGLAGLLALSRRRETGRMLGALGAILGVLVILLPTRLIGTCAMAGSPCNLIMKPALILSGAAITGTSLSALVAAVRRVEPMPDRGQRCAAGEGPARHAP